MCRMHNVVMVMAAETLEDEIKHLSQGQMVLFAHKAFEVEFVA